MLSKAKQVIIRRIKPCFKKFWKKGRSVVLLYTFFLLLLAIIILFGDYIQANSDTLMVVITFVYVIATAEICKANIRAANAAREQVAESRYQFEETKRLQMMPYFEIGVHNDVSEYVECIELAISNRGAENTTLIDRRISIKNIGLGVAKDFSYSWCNLDGCYQRNDLNFTSCVPGEEKNIFFEFWAEHKTDFREYEAPVSIVFNFFDLLENKYRIELKLKFKIAKDGEVDLIDFHVGVPEVIKETNDA